MRELEGARESSREPKRANQSQEGPRGLVSQLEPVKAREPERAIGSLRKPKGARESQKEPERARNSQQLIQSFLGSPLLAVLLPH